MDKQTKESFERVARRMAYEKLIEGNREEEELKKKDDEHIKKVLEVFGIKINYHK
tara:strand:- start:181 stop:345 length:165 start_codon:yes stop_codon:yes gene_type:complete